MKKHQKKVWISILVTTIIIVSLAVNSSAVSLFESEGYYFSIDSSSTASVYGRYSDDQSVSIPKEYSNHYVTQIAASAFSGDENLVDLDFSSADLLEKIGNFAFMNCENLSGSIMFSGRINSLGLSAFQGCDSLTSVYFYTDNVKTIPEQCFYNCSSLNEVLLYSGLERIDRYAFANTALSEITIPKTVSEIDATAFNGCNDLVIYCYTDSCALEYSVENEIPYVLLDAPSPTEPDTQEPTHQTIDVTFILGDADGDGFITILDATKVQRVLADLDDDIDGMITLRAAVDGDVLNIMHATKIQRYLAEFEVAEPIGEEVTRQIEI